MSCWQPACGCCGWRNTRTATGIFFRICCLSCKTAYHTPFAMDGEAGRARAALEMNAYYFVSGCPKVNLSIEECKKSSPHIPVTVDFSEYSFQNFV